MQALYNSTLPILIQGETGTGKTKLALEIHKQSIHHSCKFIQCNLAGLADNLFESELFGHVKGSFTGALNDKVGYCEEAMNGTLFFDEIGDINLHQQKKLLQLLDNGEFYKVGSTRKVQFNGRVIFATHRNLENRVREGKFREDLFYRLGGSSITLRPFREKTKDRKKKEIVEIMNKLKIKYDLIFKEFGPGVLDKLCAYNWPGNYRELIALLESVLLRSMRRTISENDLPERIRLFRIDCNSFKGQIENLERKIIYNELVNKGIGVNKASKSLGISKTTLIAKLRKYGISEHLRENNNLKVA